MNVRAVALALCCAVLAGCSEAPPPEAEEVPEALEELDLAATETTGVLRGVVVDEAIRPIVNATVEVSAGGLTRTTTSNEGGAFGFQDLAPGTYFVQASKIGYFAVQQSAEVVAGLSEPPAVKLLLKVDVATTPFVSAQSFDGFIECTTSVLVTCGAPNLVFTLWCNGDLDPLPPQCMGNVTNDRYTNDFYFADNATHIQFEMVWESNQAASPEMYFEMEELNGDCEAPEEGSQYDGVSAYNNTRGPSPIYATINATQVAAWEIGSKCPIYFSIFSGGIPGAPCGNIDPTGSLPNWCVGVTAEQRFSLFLHDFHGFLPQPGWRFAIDGAPTPPA